MESRTKGYFISMGILALIIIGLVFLNINQQISSLSQEILEECKTLEFKDENAINLVFFSPEEDAREYSDYLVTSEPFRDYSNDFNFFYIDSYEPECELYKGIAIYCHSKELIEKAASCPYDYIVVLDEMESQIRSSAYQNVMSINSKHPKSVFLHEFGHSFANLAEEYIPARIPRGSENCQRSCDKFEREVDGCFNGCSNSNHYRSIENGVMRTLSTDNYGAYNNYLISHLIENSVPKDLEITGAITNEFSESCKDKSYFLVKMEYRDGKFDQIGEATSKVGCSPKIRPAGENYFGVDKLHFTTLVYTIAPENDNRGVYEHSETWLVSPETIKSSISIYDSTTNKPIGELTPPSQEGNILCPA